MARSKPEKKPGRKSFKWRPWLRAIHRDVGYLAVGLTFIYAISGLAVNHIADWDPNFVNIEETHQLNSVLDPDEQKAATTVLGELKIEAPIVEVYAVDDNQFDILLENRTLHIDRQQRRAIEEGQKERFFLRLANWLHLNRGKQAWSYIADGYAVFLLFLATSGLLMIPGKKGLRWRGAALAVVGAAIPALYVVLSGGP